MIKIKILFPWVEDVGKVIPVRFRRRASDSVSTAHEASDMAQLSLPVVQAVAGAIPLFGPPMQGAISGLLAILQAIDRRGQNQADLNSLKLRLNRLSNYLCNAPPAWDTVEQNRRDSLIRMLQETSVKLTKLHNRRPEYISVTQAIAGCSSEIDRYLFDCLWSSQMQNHHDMHEISAILQQQQDNQKLLMTMQGLIIHGQSSVGPTATQSIGAVELGCVILVDATGHEHPISVNFCTSFQQLHEMLQVLFKRDSIEARIQRQYMEAGQYDLCIDDDKQVTRLTNHEWPSIEAGTKIVMRVIIEQLTPSSAQVDYRCHFCGAVNRVSVGSNCSIDCRVCKRRFQISCEPLNAEGDIQHIDSHHTTDTEMHHLIRNFLVQQTVVAKMPTIQELIQGREYLDSAMNSIERSIQTVLAQTRGFPDESWSMKLEEMRFELHNRKTLLLRVNQAIHLVSNTPGVSNISALGDVAGRKAGGPSQISMPGQAHPINSRQDGQIRRPGVGPTRSSPTPQ